MSIAVQQESDVIIKVQEGSYTLRVVDRADCCGVQSYVKAVLKTGDVLLFCRKHYLQHKAKLVPQCEVIYDESGKLDIDRLVGTEN